MAISVYAYKDRLAADFDQSLNKSMEEYGPNKIRSYDFDVMQETVVFFIFFIKKRSNLIL